jgi:uncharacterized repeat protein (TIGR04042 family)
MMFEVRWPDGTGRAYYSPSLVVQEYLEAGREYPLEDFVTRCRESMTVAGDRVFARYGMRCAESAITLEAIERAAATFEPASTVRVERFRT